MHALLTILAIMAIVVTAVVLLQSIDGMTLRRSRQMSGGTPSSRNLDYRIRCPQCDEKVIPLTGCPSCKNKIEK